MLQSSIEGIWQRLSIFRLLSGRPASVCEQDLPVRFSLTQQQQQLEGFKVKYGFRVLEGRRKKSKPSKNCCTLKRCLADID